VKSCQWHVCSEFDHRILGLLDGLPSIRHNVDDESRLDDDNCSLSLAAPLL
jgi:hypothetical protein